MAESQILSDPEFLAGPQTAAAKVLSEIMESETAERGVHVEGVVTALGALAGKACQVAVLNGIANHDLIYKGLSLAFVAGADGEEYYFGDAINRPLLESTYSVWSLIAGTINHLGAALPDLAEIVTNSTSLVGKPGFGVPRFAPGTSADLPRSYLSKWEPLLTIIKPSAPDPQQWPVVYGIAMQQLFAIIPREFDLTALARVAMDSANAMAKWKLV